MLNARYNLHLLTPNVCWVIVVTTCSKFSVVERGKKESSVACVSDVELRGEVGGCVSVCYPGIPPPSVCSVSPPQLPPCQSRTKKILYSAAEREDFDREEVPTYEEVAKLYPRPGLARPIVLIGAPGVGRNELRRRLIATDTEKYRTPIPCEY